MAQAEEEFKQLPFTTLAGSSFSNFKKICKGRVVHKAFRKKFKYSKWVSALMEILRVWEELRWSKRIHQYKMPEPPVFIIGHWRSGTTFLHNLMSKDEQFAYCTTFQGTFPNILLCHQWWFKPILKRLMPKKRPSDGVLLGVDLPQEEDFGLGNTIPNTIYNTFYFPTNFQEYLHQNIIRDTETLEDDQAFKEGYKRFTAKAMLNPIFRKRRVKRLLSKNPPHTARIDQLLELFPEARFVYLHRNPYDTIASFKEFALSILKGLKYQEISDIECYEDALIELYSAVKKKYEATKHLIPRGQLVEVAYNELINNPLITVEKIYADLKIGGFENVRKSFDQYASEQKGHKVSGYQHNVQFIRNVDGILST